MTLNESTSRAGWRAWAGLGVMCLCYFMIAIDVFVVLLAVPHLSADLGANASQQLWILDIHGFMAGGFLIAMGGLGDKIGRRKLLLIGTAAFGTASVLSAYATSPEMLIAARTLLGIAGATLPPCTLALIRTMFPTPKQMGMAIGFWSGSFTLGAIAGPVIGGAMLDRFWWGSVFLLAAPVMVLVLVTGPMLLPEQRSRTVTRLDLFSVVLSLVAVLPVIYGVKDVAQDGWSEVPILAIAAGLFAGVWFVRRQRTVPNPLIDLSFFRVRSYSIGLGSLLTYAMSTGATLAFVTMHFQLVEELTPLESGLALVPGMAMSTLSVIVAPILARWIRPAYLMSAGLAVVVCGLLLVTRVEATSGPAVLMTAFAVWCAGSGMVLALGINMVVSSAPPEKAGSASAMPQISNEFGSSLGVATLGSVGVLVFRGQMETAIPAGVPADAVPAASESMVSALTVAGTLPDEQAAALVTAAREAFTTGVHTVAMISAVALTGLAVLILTKLRGVERLGRDGDESAPRTDSGHASSTSH